MGTLSERSPATRLRELRVEDFLLIERAELDLAPGLNVLSGETGTGKSILLHALGLLLGRRGSVDWIRRDAPALAVEGVFEASSVALRFARQAGLPVEGNALVVRRELGRSGAGACRVNGRRVLVGWLARLGALLVETHGQREEERFRRSESQRDLLDRYGGHGEARRAVREAHAAEREASAALRAAEAELARLARDEDWMKFQLEEIERLSPQPGEEEELRARIARLRRARAQAEFLALAQEAFNGSDGAILEALETLDHRAGELAASDGLGETDPGARGEAGDGGREAGQGLEAWRAELREMLERARRLYRDLRRDAALGEEEREALEAAELRLSELERLQRKHRRPLDEICALGEELRSGLAALAEGQARLSELAGRRAERRAALIAAAAALSECRRRSAGRLARDLSRELEAIGMTHCRLAVEVQPLGAVGAPPTEAEEAAEGGGEGEGEGEGEGRVDGGIGPTGADRILFTVETNPGEGFRPLGEIASGGEMARVALAIRVVLGERGSPQLAVFDEIDAGLGGGAARAVAERLAQVAAHRQVLLVTHLPVIAAAAQRQFRVTKASGRGRARVEVGVVVGGERIEEIARMLSGTPRDATARRHAQALLAGGIGLPPGEGSAKE